jgi:hypothetical protein
MLELIVKANTRFSAFQINNGGEYTGNKFAAYLREQGIIHEFNYPYTLESKDFIEHENRTLMEATCSMVHK